MSVTYLPLEIWNRHWSLEGLLVRCRRCGASQDLTDGRAFSHVLGCQLWGLQAQYPCRELAIIIEQKIQAGLF